ncbi:MAG: YdbL family protein [Pseudomonadota bacterium]|nr:YdbL family protein [Pseudomonadota bacterium]
MIRIGWWGSRLALLACLAAGNAWALDLGDAKSQGVVGERRDGYVEALSPGASVEVRELVTQINAARKKAYAKAAADAGVSREVIEARMAQKLFQRADPGEFVQDSQGTWIRKP